MAACSSLRAGVGVGVHVSEHFPRTKHKVSGFCPFSQKNRSRTKLFRVLKLDLEESPLDSTDLSCQTLAGFPSHAKSSSVVGLSRRMRWWEKTLKPNMLEIRSAQHLVDCLLNAGDRLVVVDFYSPACGGCRSLHPKICQFADSNPNVIFLKVNQEELRTMCHSLNIHVLPFFRFYRGADGRLCSFSCTVATINKFKNALAKHGSERCSLRPPKGLDEKELTSLALAGELPSNLRLQSATEKESMMENLLLQMANISPLFTETEYYQERALL